MNDQPWKPSSGEHEDALTQLLFDTQEYEFTIRLPELLLMRIDRFSMANSVEARVPFLDPELVEFVYGLPMSHKLHRGVTKVVLREAMRDIVPSHVLQRPKMGFGAPIATWLNERMGDLLLSLIDEEPIRRYFDADQITTTLQSHRRNGGNAFVLWPVLNFVLWHMYWIEGKSLEDQVVLPSASIQ